MACTGQSWGAVCVRRAPPRGVQGAASYRGGAEGTLFSQTWKEGGEGGCGLEKEGMAVGKHLS